MKKISILLAMLALTFGLAFVSCDNGSTGGGDNSSPGGNNPGGGDTTWDESFNWQDVCYGNNRFVAVGVRGKIGYSDDGVTWRPAANPPFETANALNMNINAVCYGGGRFVAGGTSYVAGELVGKMAYSSDGASWTELPDAAIRVYSKGSIAYGNGRFVAAVNQKSFAYSNDGITWVASEENSIFRDNYIWTVCFGSGRFVATGAGDCMAYSDDGITWHAINSWSTFEAIGTSGQVSALAYGNGRFVAANMLGRFAYSDDAVTWSGADYNYSMVHANATDICHDGSRFVAIGSGILSGYSASRNYVARSDNGEEWTVEEPVSLRGLTLRSVTYGGGLFVIVGYEPATSSSLTKNRIMYSSDGVTWLAVTNTVF